MVWDKTEFKHTKDGIEVIVRHIPAWVCPYGDDWAFPPGGTDEIITTIRALVKVAKQARLTHHAIEQQEYLIRVAA